MTDNPFHDHAAEKRVSAQPVASPWRTAAVRLALLCLVCTTLASAGTAQFLSHVRIVNQSARERADWATATIPFPRGVWTPGRTYHVPGYISEVTPFGAKWPDGTARFGQLTVWLHLSAGQEIVLPVVEGTPAMPPFLVSPWVEHGLKTLDLSLTVGFRRGNPVTTSMQPIQVVSSTPLKKVVLFRGYVPGSDLVYDMWLTSFSYADHMPFELRVTNSRAGSSRWEQQVEYIDFSVTGATPHIHASRRKGVGPVRFGNTGPSVVRLLGREMLYDGQGQEWLGELIFFHPMIPTPGGATELDMRRETLAAVMQSQFWGCSTDWAASQTYGPFGFVSPIPPWINDGGRAAVEERRSSYISWLQNDGDPWMDWPMGLIAHPGAPGDQHDFGAAKLIDIVASGMPHGIEEARMNATEEACRPVHHREADGSPVKSANHPNWVAWDGRTHFHSVISPDRLGKPFPEPPLNAHGWYGRDVEHWSSLVLTGAYLLTGSHSLRYELDNEAELYLATRTLPSEKPGWTTNGMGASRAVGRTLLSMAWNYIATGNEAVRQRMSDRIDQVVWHGASGVRVRGPVKPLAVRQPDPRLLPVSNWRPWEESLAVIGLEACYRVTKNPRARQLAEMVTRTVTTYGWRISPGTTIIGTALAWKNQGATLTESELGNHRLALWSFGTGFNEWAVSATRFALQFAAASGDKTLLAQARYIYGWQLSRRTPPAGLGWDRFSEWEAAW